MHQHDVLFGYVALSKPARDAYDNCDGHRQRRNTGEHLDCDHRPRNLTSVQVAGPSATGMAAIFAVSGSRMPRVQALMRPTTGMPGHEIALLLPEMRKPWPGSRITYW